MRRRLITVTVLALTFFSACQKPTHLHAPVHIQASITFNPASTDCVQTVNGQEVDFPKVSKSSLDSIKWLGDAAATSPQVAFPSAHPFAQATFDNGHDSGSAVNGTAGSYYECQRVQVWNGAAFQDCGNPQDMGVRIDN